MILNNLNSLSSGRQLEIIAEIQKRLQEIMNQKSLSDFIKGINFRPDYEQIHGWEIVFKYKRNEITKELLMNHIRDVPPTLLKALSRERLLTDNEIYELLVCKEMC